MLDFYIYVLLILAVGIMVKSVNQLLTLHRIPFPVFSWRHFCVLIFIYVILIIGFTLLYIGLTILGYSGVGIDNNPLEARLVTDLGNILYFSAMTMLSVGYGDITPIGIGKLIASIQALIGYLLPTAFFVSGIISIKNRKVYNNRSNEVRLLRQKRSLK